ncbi:transcriptional regulator [Sporosarcina sp. ANT_H38]|nr:transcriptional regulator [Sporosarcina sp. ANT_H38]
MRCELVESTECNESLDMIYMAVDGSISKRRINVLQIDEVSFQVYCYLRHPKRTFTIDTILALVPIVEKESRII